MAKNKKPLTLLPLLSYKIVLCGNGWHSFGKKRKQKLQQEPLFDNVILSRILDMRNDILNPKIIDVKNSPTKILIQLDESTDIVNAVSSLLWLGM